MTNDKSNILKKVITVLLCGIALLGAFMLIMTFAVSHMDLKYNYVYENNKIVTHSLVHDFNFEFMFLTILCVILILGFIAISLSIILKLKYQEKFLFKIIIAVLLSLFSMFMAVISIFVIVPNDDDYYPEYFEFSDGNHKIVICERSWLLGGFGDVYIVNDDNTAYIGVSFTTDDGGRNNGNYEFEWSDKSVTIYYNNFTGFPNSIQSITVDLK